MVWLLVYYLLFLLCSEPSIGWAMLIYTAHALGLVIPFLQEKQSLPVITKCKRRQRCNGLSSAADSEQINFHVCSTVSCHYQLLKNERDIMCNPLQQNQVTVWSWPTKVLAEKVYTQCVIDFETNAWATLVFMRH